MSCSFPTSRSKSSLPNQPHTPLCATFTTSTGIHPSTLLLLLRALRPQRTSYNDGSSSTSFTTTKRRRAPGSPPPMVQQREKSVTREPVPDTSGLRDFLTSRSPTRMTALSCDRRTLKRKEGKLPGNRTCLIRKTGREVNVATPGPPTRN